MKKRKLLILVKCGVNLVLAIGAILGMTGFTSLYGQATDADNKIITGKVLSMENAPLPFVTIVEKGTQNGTVSNEDGEYRITVKGENSILIFSYVGYLTEEIHVGDKNVINVTLVENITQLDEIVVVGYGTQKKSDLTGSVVSVGSEELEKSAGLSIDQALQGKAAGVQILNNTGAPGSSMSVRIRGMGSLNAGQQPLYVIDGFILGDQSFGKEGSTTPDNKMGISFIDPSEIESIEILKDASAAAIYGSRGANGVVLITTKKGKSGAGKVEFNMYYGIQTAPEERYWNVMEGPEYRNYLIDRYKQRFGDRWLWIATDPDSPGQLPRFVDSSGELLPVDSYNWQDGIFKPAETESYRLNFSGGNDKSTYHISGSYYNQDGLIGNSGMNRISVRVNGDHEVNKWLKVGVNMIGTRSFRERISESGFSGSNILAGAVYADPTLSPRDSAGNWVTFDQTTSLVRNPVYTINRDKYTYENYHYLSTGYLDISILPSLKFHSVAGIDISDGMMESFDPRYYLSPIDRRDNNNYYHREERWINWDIENTLTFNKSFGKHNFTALAGFTVQKESFRDWRSNIPQFPYDEAFMRYPNIGDISLISEFASSPMEYTIASLLGRIMYNYNSKILVTTSFRRDGSSKFGPGNRYGNFPSFSLGYKLSEEKFIQNITFINFLKVRGGWGELGNQAIPPYRYSVPVNVIDVTTPLGKDETVYHGAFPDGAANEDIKWETSRQTNLGLDLGLFRDKITLTVDVFRKNTFDMLIEKPVPEYVGLINPIAVNAEPDLPIVNIAEMQNQGFEAVSTYKISSVSNDFYLNLNANISMTKNMVLSLGEGAGFPILSNHVGVLGGAISRTEIDRPLAGFYGYVIDGIYQDEEDVLNSAYINNVAPGDYKFRDIDGNDTITSADRTFIGSPLPKMTYGFGFDAGYKNFDLNCQFIGVYGNDVVNAMNYYLYGDDATNKSKGFLNRWTTENTDTDIHRLGNTRHNIGRFSDFYVEDGSFLRIKNVTIGYTFPKQWLNKMNMERLRIYATVQNLFTFTKYTGMEPEIGRSVDWSANPLDIGLDAATYPQARTFMFGLNIGF